MSKTEAITETPTAGGIEQDDTPGESSSIESVRITPMMITILGIFQEAGESGLHVDTVREHVYAPLRAARKPCPPIDEDLSSLLGGTGSGDGLIEQCPNPRCKGEWIDKTYRLTVHGESAMLKLRPLAKK